MKVSAIVAILSFTAVQAAAVAGGDSEVDKREADPRKSYFHLTSCGIPGNTCFKKRNATESETDVEKREADPRKSYFHLTSCGIPGNTCFKKRDAAEGETDVEKREADPRKSYFHLTSCGIPGNTCFKKREASPRWSYFHLTSCGIPGNTCFKTRRSLEPVENDPEDLIEKPDFTTGICGVPGNPCAMAKRAALAVAEAIAEPRKSYFHLTSCGIPGNTCFKARRSLEGLGAMTEEVLDKVLDVDQDEEAIEKRNLLVRPSFPGAKNGPKYQGLEEHHYANAKRGVELLEKDFPGMHKDQCFSQGGECHTIKNAHSAFHAAVKREADARERGFGVPADARWHHTSCGLPGTSCARDASAAEQEKLQGTPEYTEAEKECWAEDGKCTAAQAYIEQLGAALDQANEDTITSE